MLHPQPFLSFCPESLHPQAAAIGEFRTWSSCTVPLSVVANREHYADGHEEMWLLIDTKEAEDPTNSCQDYHLRIAIEERHRQLKCFSDLTNFTSRAFSMVVNQAYIPVTKIHIRYIQKQPL